MASASRSVFWFALSPRVERHSSKQTADQFQKEHDTSRHEYAATHYPLAISGRFFPEQIAKVKLEFPGRSPNRHAWRARCLGDGKLAFAQAKGTELLHFVEAEAEG